MAFAIRQASPADAQQWLGLLAATIGNDYPSREVFDLAWIEAELAPTSDHETWVVAENDRLLASISFLRPDSLTDNPVANLGRGLHLPESFTSGASAALLAHVTALADERGQMAIARVPAASAEQQQLYGGLGYACVGFQPLKHVLQARQGILFYVHAAERALLRRVPVVKVVPGLDGLARLALANLCLSTEFFPCDGMVAYPPACEFEVFEATHADFEMWHQQAGSACCPPAVSTGFNRGCGLLRTRTEALPHALLARRDSVIVAGLAYIHDEVDCCIRVLGAFATEELAYGSLLDRLVHGTQEQVGAAYVEMDLLPESPRMVRTAERFGFEPVAYLPGFFRMGNRCLDVVKMVKLNILYDPEYTPLTDPAAAVVRVVDGHFESIRHGTAIVGLLRTLPLFQGLGDGELGRIVQLFIQRLYRPGEVIFRKGEEGTYACVIMRGQIGIYLESPNRPVAMVQAGEIIGELAFLDSAPRAATAVAASSSVVLVLERSAFEELLREEPFLGQVVMRNIALDLSRKLRRTNIHSPA
jgi:RimJ/RimL family protein N-acetyltransferase